MSLLTMAVGVALSTLAFGIPGDQFLLSGAGGGLLGIGLFVRLGP